jgi:ubiquinol-cytochrome c reductase subunit 9
LITVPFSFPVPGRSGGKMAGLAGRLYNPVFRRTSTFAATILFGAFFFERAFDVTSEHVFYLINQEKLWKHIKHNFNEFGGEIAQHCQITSYEL